MITSKYLVKYLCFYPHIVTEKNENFNSLKITGRFSIFGQKMATLDPFSHINFFLDLIFDTLVVGMKIKLFGGGPDHDSHNFER